MVQKNVMSRTIRRVSLGVLIAVFVGLVALSPNTLGETRIPITQEYILVRDTPTPEKGTSVYGLRTWEHQYTVTNTPGGSSTFRVVADGRILDGEHQGKIAYVTPDGARLLVLDTRTPLFLGG